MYSFTGSSSSVQPQQVVIPKSTHTQDLTQFLYRKRQDKQRRAEAFTKGLSVEDVDGISQSLLDKQAQRRNDYYQKWTEKYKQSGGRLSETDLLDLTKEKSDMLREQKRMLMAQKNWQDQANLYNKNPEKYDPSTAASLSPDKFDWNDPSKNYLELSYTPVEEGISERMKNRKLNETTSIESLGKDGGTTTTTQTTSDILKEENLPNVMIQDFRETPSIKRTVLKELTDTAGQFQKIIDEAEADKAKQIQEGTWDDSMQPKNQVLTLAKEFQKRYGGTNGAEQYFIDNYKDEYQRYATKSTTTRLPDKPKEGEKDKRDVIEPEEEVLPSGVTIKAWKTRTKPIPFTDKPNRAYTPDASGNLIEVTDPSKYGNYLSSGKIVKVTEMPTANGKDLFAVIQYNLSEDGGGMSFNTKTGEIKTGKSGTDRGQVYVPFDELSSELKREFNYKGMEEYKNKKTKSFLEL